MNSAAIASAMVRQVFNAKALLMVPECYWTGHECDVLVVMPDLRLVDVEIKTSRADFRRDAAKDKWYHSYDWTTVGPYNRANRQRREWPRRVWKHYFAMPEAIWTDDLAEQLPSQASGVILLRERDDRLTWRCQRRAKPDREAERIKPEQAMDIARLAGLRMWDALTKVEHLMGMVA